MEQREYRLVVTGFVVLILNKSTMYFMVFVKKISSKHEDEYMLKNNDFFIHLIVVTDNSVLLCFEVT